MRRIYTDGRPHPDEPDPTFHGHSIGHWEGDTLVVDTVGNLLEVYLAISEAVGVPNNGDMHIVERIHLAASDVLHDDLEITAPKILTAPWKTIRIYFRQRARKYDIVEGVCIQGEYSERKRSGWQRRVRLRCRTTEGGNLVAPTLGNIKAASRGTIVGRITRRSIDETTWTNSRRPRDRPACGLGVGMSSATAHHSTTMFDHSKTMTIKGTVVELRWTNPHVSLLVNGTSKDGEEPTLWLLEMTSRATLCARVAGRAPP